MKIRIPVDSTILQRASAIGKDSLLTNTFVDTSKSETKYVTKRPGFLLGIGGVTNGINYGIYINPNSSNFYYVGENGQPILGSPPNYWNSNTSYAVGQRVIYKDNTTLSKGNKIYTATNNNINSIPSSTNINWGGTLNGWILVNTITPLVNILTIFYDGSIIRYVDSNNNMYSIADFTTDSFSFISSGNNISPGNTSEALFDSINSRFLYFWNNGGGLYFYYQLTSPYNNWSTQQNPISGTSDYFDSQQTTIYNNYIYAFPNNNIANGLIRLNINTMLLDSGYIPTGLPTTGNGYKFFKDSLNLYLITDLGIIYKSFNGINWSLFYTISSINQYHSDSSATLFNGKIYLVNYSGGNTTGREVLSFDDNGNASSVNYENTGSQTLGFSFLYKKGIDLYKIDMTNTQLKIYKRP